MIHYYIISNGLTDISPHGKIFRWHMNRLYQQYGWNITISQNITEWKVANHNLKSSYLVMAVELNDGKCFCLSSIQNTKTRLTRMANDVKQ